MGLQGLPLARANGLVLRVVLVLVLVLTLAAAPARAVEVAGLEIYNASDKYEYAGCWNETTELPDTTRRRALDGGTHVVRQDAMTAPLCLEFCSTAGNAYAYAGLEYSRECWCANELSVLSERLPDNHCNQTCDGAPEFACGGNLKLSVYKVKSYAAGRVSAYGGAGIVAVCFVLAVCIM